MIQEFDPQMEGVPVYFFTAAGFVTRHHIRAAFDVAEKKLRTGRVDVGLLNLKDDPAARFRLPFPFVSVALSPDRAVIERAERLLRAGTPLELEDGMMGSLVRRRVRVALDAIAEGHARGEPPGMIRHRVRTEGGMEVRPDGTTRLRQRGQG